MKKKSILIAVSLIITLIVLVVGLLLWNNSRNVPINSPTSIPIETFNNYSFENFPISFQYNSEVAISKINENVTLTYKGNVMKIVPNQKGLGFEDPAPEVTNQPLLVNGQNLIINGHVVNKMKIYYKDTNETSYLIVIPYSDSQSRGYSILISYGDLNQETMNKFDNIIKNLKVV